MVTFGRDYTYYEGAYDERKEIIKFIDSMWKGHAVGYNYDQALIDILLFLDEREVQQNASE